MAKRIFWLAAMICLFAFQTAIADTIPNIEVFDIAKGTIVKQIKNTPEVQKEIQATLGSVSGLAQPLNYTPKEGKLVRIPLRPPIQVENQWLKVQSNEIFLVLIPSEQPMVILYDQDKPYLVHVRQLPTTLIQEVNSSN